MRLLGIWLNFDNRNFMIYHPVKSLGYFVANDRTDTLNILS